MRILLATLFGFATPLGAQVPVWTVATRPMTVIGVNASDAQLQLAGVLGVHRMADGRVLVADSVPLQLRIFDARGALVSQLGRRGAGPGEFRGRITLYDGRGDSVLAYDESLNRWTLYSPDLRFVRTWPSMGDQRQRFDPIAYHRALIHPAPSPLSACYPLLINGLPPMRDSLYREVFRDGADRAWVRDEGTRDWMVHALAGKVIGRVALPAGFELLQVGDGFVAGTRRDVDDVERVEVLAVSMPRHDVAPACARQVAVLPVDRSPETRTLQIDLRNLAVAGEAFRADYGHYAMTFDSVVKASNFSVSRETELHLMARNGEGWDAVARNPHLHRYCRILIGDVSPGWLYRFPFCGP